MDSPGLLLALCLLGVAAGVYLLWRGLAGYRTAVTLGDTATSSITSLAAGEVRITGTIDSVFKLRYPAELYELIASFVAKQMKHALRRTCDAVDAERLQRSIVHARAIANGDAQATMILRAVRDIVRTAQCRCQRRCEGQRRGGCFLHGGGDDRGA